MTVYQWSDHCFAAYVGVTSRPFSGRFVGTEQTREGAQCLAAQAQHAARPALRGVQVCEDRAAGSESTTPGQPAPPGALVTLDRRHLTPLSKNGARP